MYLYMTPAIPKANSAKYQLDMNMTAMHSASPVNDNVLWNSKQSQITQTFERTVARRFAPDVFRGRHYGEP